jgi:GNAT superfamily N-acetyltransferase
VSDPRPPDVVIRDLAFDRKAFPRELEIQVLTFMRIEWGDAFREEDRFRSRLWESDAAHFVRAVGDLLVSHAQVLSLAFGDEDPLLVGGVSSVLTFPAFRGQGHGSAVMRSAARHIEHADLHVGILFCDPKVEPFYAQLGWRTLPAGRVLVNGSQPNERVMILGDADALPEPFRLDWTW